MRGRGSWLVCGVLSIFQLGCSGDADSVERAGAPVPGDEPREEPTPDEPMASSEPLLPGEDAPPASGQPPPFNRSETDSCSTSPEFLADTPLDDTRGTGFSALDMLSIFNEQGSGTLTWHDGTTTTLSIAASVVGDTSVVDDPPRGEGHCVPFRQVPIQLRIESADGRLADDVASELVAVGYDGNIESIWVADSRVPLEELQGTLEVPSDWLIAGHTERRLDIATAWVAPDALSPFCTPADVPSTEASEDCNVYTGVVRFFSSTPAPTSADDPAEAVELSESFDVFRGVVGSWVLAR